MQGGRGQDYWARSPICDLRKIHEIWTHSAASSSSAAPPPLPTASRGRGFTTAPVNHPPPRKALFGARRRPSESVATHLALPTRQQGTIDRGRDRPCVSSHAFVSHTRCSHTEQRKLGQGMDQASGAGVAASRSSSANHRAASSRAGTVAQDEQVLSAMISRLRLQASQATAPQHGPASAVGTSSLGPAGPGRTSPPAISRLAAGRGLGMTTPARMTSRAHAAAVPGGLREQVPRDTGARAGPAGPSSPFTKQSSQGGHQAGPSEDTSFELLGVPKKGKKSKSKKKKQQQLDKASPGGAGVLGSARADQARSSGLAPASEPITGTRVAGPTVAAGSPQLDPRWTAAGRSGLGTIPAAVPQGGLQEQAPRGSDATTQPQVSRPTGLYSSRPQQSSQSSQSGLGASNPTGHRSKKHTYTKYEHQAAAAGGGTHGVFSTGLPAAAPPTTVVASNRAARAGVSAAARGAERGREKKLPARAYPLAQAAVRAALPGGLQHPSTIGPPGGLQQQQLPHGGGAWAQVPRATASNFHRAAAHQVEDHVFQNNNERATATNINRQQVERAPGGKPATASRPTFALGRAAGGEGSAAGLAGALYRREASGKVGSAGPTSDISSKQKRRRDEEPAEGIPTPSSAFGQPASSVADPMDVGGRAAGRGSEPRSKKNKATLAESKPSQVTSTVVQSKPVLFKKFVQMAQPRLL